MDPEVAYLLAEFIPEDGIAIAQQVARELVKWECLPQLLSVHSAVEWEVTLKWTMRRRSWANTKIRKEPRNAGSAQ